MYINESPTVQTFIPVKQSILAVAMLLSKICVVFFLFFVHGCMGKPATGEEITEGRGMMSTIWEWIKYPFSWWSSEETDQPVTEPLIASTTTEPNNSINIETWCNDQICTTWKCNKGQCRNITCSIYDTNLRGECKEYIRITDTDVPPTVKSTEPTSKEYLTSKPTESFKTTSTVPTTEGNDPQTEEHPLVLEELMSSTVNNQNPNQY